MKIKRRNLRTVWLQQDIRRVTRHTIAFKTVFQYLDRGGHDLHRRRRHGRPAGTHLRQACAQTSMPWPLLRFGFAPSYLRHVDVWDAVEHLREVLETREWKDPALARRQAVT